MIPVGDLLRSRVVTDLTPVLEDALDRRLDGYAVLAPRDALLGGDDDRCELTFEGGVPAVAYHAGTDHGGPPALADVGAGPYRVELYAVEAGAVELPGMAEELRVPPGLPAERLAGDPTLAERVRPAADGDHGANGDTLVAFLEDEAAVEAIRTSAREEAERRAEEWASRTPSRPYRGPLAVAAPLARPPRAPPRAARRTGRRGRSRIGVRGVPPSATSLTAPGR